MLKLLKKIKRYLQPVNKPPVIIYNVSTGKCSGGYSWSPGSDLPDGGRVVIIDDIPR